MTYWEAVEQYVMQWETAPQNNYFLHSDQIVNFQPSVNVRLNFQISVNIIWKVWMMACVAPEIEQVIFWRDILESWILQVWIGRVWINAYEKCVSVSSVYVSIKVCV